MNMPISHHKFDKKFNNIGQILPTISNYTNGHFHFETYKEKILDFTPFFVFSIASPFLIVLIRYFQMLLYMDQSLFQWKNGTCMLFFYGYIWIFTFPIHTTVHPGFWEFESWYFHFHLEESWKIKEKNIWRPNSGI